MSMQLPLSLQLRDDATFDNFFVGHNQHLVDVLKNPSEKFIYFAGQHGVGRSHLLQACCHFFEDSIYIPLSEHEQLSPSIFEDMESIGLICLDDIDAVFGLPDWEVALFHFYNRISSSGSRLCVAASHPLQDIKVELPDLKTRLSSFVFFPVHDLSDQEKIAVFVERANFRGLDMPVEVAEFLFNRLPRDMRELFSVLDKLDEASLAAKRRLTVPFVKEVLDI